MRLLDRLTARYQPADVSVRTQGYYEGMASGAAVLMAYGGDANSEKTSQSLVAAAQQAYITNGVVFAVMTARQMLLSEATFTYRNKVDGKTFGNENLRILEYPWPNGTTGELIATMDGDVSWAGNSFIWQAEPDLLVRVPPWEMTIISAETTNSNGNIYRQIIGYDWDPGLNAQPGFIFGRPPQYLTVDEVAHWSPLPDPQANYRGMSWMTPVMANVISDASMTGYKTQYMDHGQPVSAVKYPGKLRPDTIDAVIDRMGAKYGGVSNAWKTLVFDQGADPIMGAALKDLDFRNVQAGDASRICSAGGVPELIVGLRSEEAGEQYAGAMRRFGELTCRPLWRSMCRTLQKFVPNMPPKGVELWYDTVGIAALQSAEIEKAQATQVQAAATLTLVQAGMTRESVIAAVAKGDLSLLVPDPLAPTPGVAERETITAPAPFDATGQVDPGGTVTTTGPSGTRPPRTGTPPGGGQTLTQPQTPASKTPAPSSLPTPKTVTAGSNGK